MSILDPNEMKWRCRAIRLPVNQLADLAGINKDTVHHLFNGTKSPRLDTLRAVSAALEAEERRVLAHLAALHPFPVTMLPVPTPLPGPPQWERDIRAVTNGVAA
jgi:transcriptional regulator with XRE-family HTH domain